jgi:hypothetical protein
MVYIFTVDNNTTENNIYNIIASLYLVSSIYVIAMVCNTVYKHIIYINIRINHEFETQHIYMHIYTNTDSFIALYDMLNDESLFQSN